MRIIGIDPGSRTTGYGIVEFSGSRLSFVSCGTIRTASGQPLPERLKIIHQGLTEVIDTHRPTIAAVEEVFVAANPRSALILGHARGVAILAAIEHDLSIFEYSPREIKRAVVGYGQAAKEQVQQMIMVLLGLTSAPSKDAADALAVAVCHAHLPANFR